MAKLTILLRRTIRFFRHDPKALVGTILVALMLLLSLGAPLFTSYDPVERIGPSHHPPNREHILGTTQLGRDVFAQTIYGGRTSIMIGLLSGTIAVGIAMVLGVVAGYFKGFVDKIITSIINIVMVIPSIPLLLVLAAMIGEISPLMIGVIIGLTSWAWGSRIIRAQTMSISSRDFVHAAEALGEPSRRILFFEVLPNMISILSDAFIGTVVYAIVAEATLEFLGFGDPLSVTWGIMLYNAHNSAAMRIGAWWELLGPCLGLITLGTGLTLINFSIDEISNPKLKSRKIMAYFRREEQRELKRKRRGVSPI